MLGLSPSRISFALALAGMWLAVALCAPHSAAAQTRGIDVQTFLPPSVDGTTFTIDRPSVPRHLTFVGGLASSYAYAPLSRTSPDGSHTPMVRGLWQTELLGAVGLFETMELGLAIPLVDATVANDFLAATPTYASHVTVGDPRASLKMPILRGAFSLSFRGVVSVALGASDHNLGGRRFTAMPSAIASYETGKWSFGAELGYRFRHGASIGNLVLGNEAQFGVGAAYQLVKQVSLIAEFQARLGLGSQGIHPGQNPSEIDAGVRLALSKAWTLDIGGGTGVVAGYGAPLARGFLIARFASEDEPCAAGPEDYDGFEDGDFCADRDNDADTIEDAVDECPNDAEDRDGFRDDDGCPDLDNDADGLRDDADQCPNDAEDPDGFRDDDGCPDADNDDDGVADNLDDCPMEPEDRDGFQDDDGCPEPGPRTATVTVTDTRILISERIYFDFDHDTIRSVSMPLLDQVAAVILELDGHKHVRVEGYTDDQGSPEYNADLSARRARSVVEYLVTKGVPRDRIDSAGYGSQHPVAPNDSSDGRALNRRVEFTIGDAVVQPAVPSPASTAPHHHHHHHTNE